MRKMLNMTAYRTGDVVLGNFVFTDATGTKRRPIVVVSAEVYQRGRREVIAAAITSNVGRLLIGDHLISDWRTAGLLFPSVATGIIRTIKQSMIVQKLGRLSTRDLRGVENKLKESLGLV